MNKFLKILAAIALVMVILVLAANLIDTEPTSTVAPTRYATAVPTAEPTLTDEAYKKIVVSYSEKMASALGAMSQLLSAPIPGNQAWIDKVVAQTRITEDVIDEFRGVSPPEKWQTHYDLTIEAGDYFYEAMGYARRAVQENDLEATSKVIELFGLGNSTLNLATEETKNVR